MSFNHLASEKSPYLLQHKDNPVWWHSWGEEAFKKARVENKPIFLSIGYSTCYWCHVMEKDSFEIEEVAKVLNEYFVSIKVDREERPDVDALYMEAVAGLTGQGGWPLSVFLTPELKPFWGGTFFYREQFLKILRAIHENWEEGNDKIEIGAEHITSFLAERQIEEQEFEPGFLYNVFKAYEKNFDSQYGGFGSSPKFPPSMQLSLLLRIQRRVLERPDKELALKMVTESLDAMAYGGLFDHLGGGFHRYSTDTKWLVPHFEKMLYDNSLLTMAYLEAYQVTRREAYAEVARETLNYVIREMSHTEGGFHSAQDAGEVGREGEFYVWTEEELEVGLGTSELTLIKEVFDIPKEGNFENGKIILNMKKEVDWDVRSRSDVNLIISKLFKIRSKRVFPRRDEKILVAWNGLMLSALAKAFQVLGDVKYLEYGKRIVSFIEKNLWKDGVLFRSYCGGEAKHAACLDDYAYFIEGLISLYECESEYRWLCLARELQEKQDQIFWDYKGSGYFYSSAKEIIVRKKDFIDGATPSGNSVSLLNLLRLYALEGQSEYLDKSNKLLSLFSGICQKHPTAFPKALQGFDFWEDGGKEIVVLEGKHS